MSTVRLRRLQSDAERLRRYIRRHPRLQLIRSDGDPPERYQIEYQLLSLLQKDGELVEVRSHLVEIALPLNYPRMPPLCRMLTPVFHPNIAPHAICIGDHWSPGESFVSIVTRIGEMLAYQSYNTKSPLNGEAARWVVENADRLPLDPVSMILEAESDEAGQSERSTAVRIGPPEDDEQPTNRRSTQAQPQENRGSLPVAVSLVACPTCGAKLRLASHLAGKLIRCPRCRETMVVPAV